MDAKYISSTNWDLGLHQSNESFYTDNKGIKTKQRMFAFIVRIPEPLGRISLSSYTI